MKKSNKEQNNKGIGILRLVVSMIITIILFIIMMNYTEYNDWKLIITTLVIISFKFMLILGSDLVFMEAKVKYKSLVNACLLELGILLEIIFILHGNYSQGGNIIAFLLQRCFDILIIYKDNKTDIKILMKKDK